MTKQCYASNGTDCTVLKVRACNPRGCSFYKTREQQEEQVRLAQVRCAQLGIVYGRTVGQKE